MARDAGTTSFFAVLDRVGTFVTANLLWIFCSLPIVTMPAATAGLFAILAPWARGKQPEPFAAFFGAFRQQWRKSTVIFVIDLIVASIVVANVSILARMDMGQFLTRISQVMTLFLAIVALMINLYVWPLLVTFEMPLRQIFNTAARLAFGHAIWSLGLLIAALLPLLLTLLLPAMFAVILTFATSALIVSLGSWRVIRRYVVPEELAKLEAQKTM
ncbi:MAG: DUF624 domain-containing protein [Chloroflexota bacterium]